jgi:ribose transport system substrate-binding protein
VDRTWARRGFLAALVTLGAMLAGCGRSGGTGAAGNPSGGGSAPKLLFISNSNSDWWNAVEKGMQDAGKELGCDVELRRNDSTTQGQVTRLQEALSLPGIQGVAVSVIEADAPGVVDAMKALRQKGIFVIAIDSDVSKDYEDARQAYIGTNNVKAGEVAGKAAALLRPKGGVVDVFVGTAAAANARERRDGFFQGAGAAFKLGKTWEDGNDISGKALEYVKTSVQSNPDIDVLLGLWSYNAPRIAEVVKENPEVRKHANVVTFDLDEGAVEHLESGNIDVSVAQNPYEMGYQGVKLLKALVLKDEKTVQEVLPDGKSRDTGVRVIVPKADSPVKELGAEVITIDEMKSWLASKGLKSS